MLCFVIFVASVRALRARQTTKLVGHILTDILAFVSAPQTTPPCFAPFDDRGDRTNQLHWLELLHTSYLSLLGQAGKGRVFYSVDKCFETEADPRNIFDKQILKIWTPCLWAFQRLIPRVTFT